MKNRLKKKRLTSVKSMRRTQELKKAFEGLIDANGKLITEQQNIIARQNQQIVVLRAALEQHPLARWDKQDEEDAKV